MSVWVVANQKGGVGKTTTAVTLAGIAAERGESCLLIDLDPHGSASHYLRAKTLDGAEKLLTDADLPTPVPSGVAGIEILAASARLATLERMAIGRGGQGMRLRERLQPFRARYARIVIDTPPMLGTLLINALAAADVVIAPTQVDPLALHGLEGLMRTVEMMRRANCAVPEPVILPTLMDRRVRISHTTLEELRQRWGERVFTTPVPLDTRLREAARDGLPVNMGAPYRAAASAYEKLYDHLTEATRAAA
jgi:chromosome partitioning protein